MPVSNEHLSPEARDWLKKRDEWVEWSEQARTEGLEFSPDEIDPCQLKEPLRTEVLKHLGLEMFLANP